MGKNVVATLLVAWMLLVAVGSADAIIERMGTKNGIVVDVRAPEGPGPERPADPPVQPGEREGPCASRQECNKP